jgi:site-specific recombinase XerD
VTYAYEIEAFFEWCDRRGLDVLDLDREHIDDYRQQQLDAHQESTVAKKLSALSSFYRYGLSERKPVVEDNPVAPIERPDVSRESRTAGLDADEVARFLTAAETLDQRDRAVAFVLYATGTRISELCGARASRLRTLRGHLQMEVQRKGGKTSWVTMRPEAARALHAYLDGRQEGPMFYGAGGGPISRHEVATILDDLTERAKIEGKRITPHSMRHTYATMALDAGVDIRDVQEAMGHSSIETTMRYNRARSTVERSPTHALAWSS